MKQRNLWLGVLVAGSLLGGSLLGPLSGLEAAPAPHGAEKAPVNVNVNKASASELEAIRGIGPMLAERIVKYRETNGHFERPEDLVKVPGIGQAKLEKIKDQISL